MRTIKKIDNFLNSVRDSITDEDIDAFIEKEDIGGIDIAEAQGGSYGLDNELCTYDSPCAVPIPVTRVQSVHARRKGVTRRFSVAKKGRNHPERRFPLFTKINKSMINKTYAVEVQGGKVTFDLSPAALGKTFLDLLHEAEDGNPVSRKARY